MAVLGVGWGKMDKSKTDKVVVLEVKWLGHIHPPEKNCPLVYFVQVSFTQNTICAELGHQQESAMQKKKMAL